MWVMVSRAHVDVETCLKSKDDPKRRVYIRSESTEAEESYMFDDVKDGRLDVLPPMAT